MTVILMVKNNGLYYSPRKNVINQLFSYHPKSFSSFHLVDSRVPSIF
jgi:hypothetical protein